MSVRLRSVVPMALCCLGLAHGGPAAAQTTLTLELGGSQVGPATDFDMADARFVIGGLRGTVNGANGSYVYGSFLGGNVLGDSTGGSFVSGLVAASVRDPWSERWIGSVDVKLLGFGVREPFPYRTVAAELEPAVRYQTASASLKVGLVGGVGHSSLELFFPRMGLGLDLENDLWRVGSSSELLVGSSTVQVGIAGSAHRTSADSYASVGGRLVLGGEWGVVELRGDRWSTPFGWETTGGLSLAIPFGGSMSVRGFIGRSDPDPLTLTQPGSGSGGALLGWTFLSTAPKLRRAPARDRRVHGGGGPHPRFRRGP